MYDLISIGNISIDLYFQDPSLTYEKGRFQLAVGGKYFAHYFHSSVGGGGANVAISAQKHGIHTAVLGKIGNNSFKEVIVSALKKNDVTTYLCQLENEYMNISSILLNNAGERTIIHYESPHQHLLKSDQECIKLRNTKHVFVGNLPDVSLTERLKLLSFFRKQNIHIFANLGVRDCRRAKKELVEYLEHVDVLIVNGHELSDIVKKDYAEINFNQDVRSLFKLLQAKLVIVTDGKRGSYGYVNGKIHYQKAIPVSHIIDSTGAGDGYTGAFIAEYIKSKNIKKAMEQGAQYAAKVLIKVGAN